jgi:hypothetical protein
MLPGPHTHTLFWNHAKSVKVFTWIELFAGAGNCTTAAVMAGHVCAALDKLYAKKGALRPGQQNPMDIQEPAGMAF